MVSSLDNKYAGIDFSPFRDEQDFANWVSANRGSDVMRAYRTQMDEMLARKEIVNPMRIIDKIDHATRMVDLSRSNLRVKFG